MVVSAATDYCMTPGQPQAIPTVAGDFLIILLTDVLVQVFSTSDRKIILLTDVLVQVFSTSDRPRSGLLQPRPRRLIYYISIKHAIHINALSFQAFLLY